MTPVLVTPPASLPVTLEFVRDRCRISDFVDDVQLEMAIRAAVARLDGFTGVLGRCIMPQTWRVTACAGDVVLPMPDVTAATVDDVPVTVTASALGPVVTLAADGDVEFTCALPEYRLPLAQMAIALMVQRDYDMASGPVRDAFELSIEHHIGPLRWMRL